ncbi:MAG: hypothetical protein LBR70_04505 [Lactobacillaceae bacterium]|jgi:hypothetical protein|nr:hypothetical protein [Lactobacillaceae bacterium]
MENVSNLLKEAKPLYFARKRRNNRIKATLGMLVCVLMLGVFYPVSQPYYDVDSEIYSIYTGSVISDMGLPTDEYGLLMVL